MDVTIGPFPLSAAPRVWLWMNDFRWRVADDFGPQTLEEFVEQCMLRSRTEQQWAVYRDGEICGFITFEPVNPVSGQAHCLFRKDFWGRGTTETALRMVAREIFSGGVKKISMTIFSDNKAIKALLLKLGARQEGLLRQQTVRGGKPVDMVVLGLLAEEFEEDRCPGQETSQKAFLEGPAPLPAGSIPAVEPVAAPVP